MTTIERPWRVRYYYQGTAHVTHRMSRLSAESLSETFRRLDVSACAVPYIERRPVRSVVRSL
jgi:hypothetical protein